ncbi:MAG: carboxypeptidase-like regulatory domain-containing protein, partial [Bacteroidales bacterium]
MKRFTVLLAFLVFAGLQLVHAQRMQITGTVTNSQDGSTLPGVSVVVKGTTIGTITDYDGTYQLSVPEDATTLVFSFIGMKTLEVPIEGRTTVDVALEPDVLGLDEVVVTALGITRARKAVGYSVQDISGEDISDAQSTHVLNAISGKVAGVQITNSAGAAGSSVSMVIRGPASLTRSNQPLFVVDGVPIDNSQIYSGNPDDGTNNLLEGVAYSNR